MTIVAIIIGVVIASGVYFYIGLSRLSENAELQENNIENIGNENQNGAEDNKESINILALGVDIGTAGAESERDPKRTDTMMVIHYDKLSKAVSIVSIPRDTLIKVNKKNTKINAAHAIGGVRYAVDAVEKLLDIDINYYGKVNYEGFREIIDSIGGVDIQIENNMDYDDSAQDLHIHFKKGETVHLDGKKAEEFFRWRKNNNGTGLAEGDLGRIENQHAFISKVMDKLKSPKIIPRIPSIFMTLPKYAETNMSGDEIIKYGYAFIRSGDVNIETLKGHTKYIGGISYFVYDKNKNKELLSKINNVTVDNKVNIDKSKLNIQVLNGTDKTGLAARYREYLREKGYNNISVGNTEYSEDTRIFLSKNFNNKQVKYIKQDFKINNIKNIEKNDEKFDIIVILGKNNKVIQ
ncbi:LytR family transcriptional regulator [Clostridium bovifaecis]|uniref:LytR family transcriptional regulator n=1 Tax=Clostridium bovifaecis TaxID=2184719 RepID=A0A6I6F8W1_9CLOT|nr:LytR family transcriptional regulator [Clostridium bovifaecis]